MTTKNRRIRGEDNIHGSVTIIFRFDEIVELLAYLEEDDAEPLALDRARRKLVQARNTIRNRGR